MAEGGALLRRYTGKTRIEGSNPSLSANYIRLRPCKRARLAAVFGPAPLLVNSGNADFLRAFLLKRFQIIENDVDRS